MPINSTLREFESLADLIAWNYRKITGNETAKAEYEIKKCLVTGAVAAHLGIEIDSAEFEEFCSHRRIQTTDEDALAAAKYLLLEMKVLKQIGVTA